MRSKRIFVVTALTVDEDAGLEWQLRVQAHNLAQFSSQESTIAPHVALIILPPLPRMESVPIREGKGAVHGIGSTIVRHVRLESDAEWDKVRAYRPLAKLFGLRTAIRMFAKSYFLYVDPDVVFTYSPYKRLAGLTETGASFASNCNSYLKSSSLAPEIALRVFRTSANVQQAILFGGAQYLLAPGALCESEVADMINTAAELFEMSGRTLWIAEMLAWYACLPALRITVHPALHFKLVHSPFSLSKFGSGSEALMVHLAGNFDKDPSLLNKHAYRDGRSPFNELERIAREKMGNTQFASWFYVCQLLEAAGK